MPQSLSPISIKFQVNYFPIQLGYNPIVASNGSVIEMVAMVRTLQAVVISC